MDHAAQRNLMLVVAVSATLGWPCPIAIAKETGRQWNRFRGPNGQGTARAAALVRKAPRSGRAEYALGRGPYLHKTVTLATHKGGRTDRLTVPRFSVAPKASRDGQGEPVFVGDWFVGVDFGIILRVQGKHSYPHGARGQ